MNSGKNCQKAMSNLLNNSEQKNNCNVKVAHKGHAANKEVAVMQKNNSSKFNLVAAN